MCAVTMVVLCVCVHGINSTTDFTWNSGVNRNVVRLEGNLYNRFTVCVLTILIVKHSGCMCFSSSKYSMPHLMICSLGPKKRFEKEEKEQSMAKHKLNKPSFIWILMSDVAQCHAAVNCISNVWVCVSLYVWNKLLQIHYFPTSTHLIYFIYFQPAPLQ